jgi:glutamyl-tRNA synthetase
MDDKIRDLILKCSLQNAVFHSGKSACGPVLGKIVSQSPEMRNDIKKLQKEIDKIVKDINKMTPEQQKEKLRSLDSSMLEKECKKQGDLPELPNAVQGKVVTRFAPSPTGPLSLGHFLRAVMLNYLYAKKYNGKFILRIEDTDPIKIKKEYCDWIKEDLTNFGVKWDEIVLQSDRMDLYYKHAEELIKSGKAYVCTCAAEDFKELKLVKKDCVCRQKSGQENLKCWKDMLDGRFEEGEAVVRLKTSMKDPNPVLRDPPLLRVSKQPHPLKGSKYNVWPLYNFSCVIDDHFLNITHVFRGKEHEHNTAVQKMISDIFGWKFPTVINFGMIYLPGEKIHTRHIKEWIKEGQVSGWDDPKLTTLRTLLRRGFQPDALKQYAVCCGLTKNDITLSWENMESFNRSIIDPIANRYMVVKDPVKISVESGPDLHEVSENLHIDFPERGKKKMPVKKNEIYVSKEDFERLKGRKIRLKDLFNIKLGEKSKYTGNEVIQEMPKIQWVSEPHVKIRVLTPKDTWSGFGEKEMEKLKVGDLIQMERIGFGRIDSKEKDLITIVFAHK